MCVLTCVKRDASGLARLMVRGLARGVAGVAILAEVGGFLGDESDDSDNSEARHGAQECNLRFDHKGEQLGESGAGWRPAFRPAGAQRSRGREVATCKRGLWFTSKH